MHASLLGPTGFLPAAGIPLTDRGFRYGMSVFETIAIRDAAPLLLDAHLEKLAAAVAAAGFAPPAHWSEAGRFALARPPIDEGVVRLYVTAGDYDDAESRVALLFEPLPLPTELTAARAVTVEFTPATPFGKTGNYWPHFLARPPSGEEPILVTPTGTLLGGASGNLVLLRDGQFLTPAHPIRRGVVADWVNAAPAALSRADLATADAAFLTNSRVGLRALTAIDGRNLVPNGRSITELWQRYRAEVLRVR